MTKNNYKDDPNRCNKCGRKKNERGKCPACGQPSKFTPDKLLATFKNYVKHCEDNDKFPNIAGFSIFAGMNRSTPYEYIHNRPEFSHTMAYIEHVLLDISIQKGVEKSNPFVQFYMKNKFKWSDKQEIEHSGGVEVKQKMKTLLKKIEKSPK